MLPVGNNLHPARGRKLTRSDNLYVCTVKQLTPRQGTKTFPCRLKSHHTKKQLTPRQGTKTGKISSVFHRNTETTYTPSGDENLEKASIRHHDNETTYTPSGDENLMHTTSGSKHAGNNLHPVRGRKPTTTIMERMRTNERNNLHPVRGRKPLTVAVSVTIALKQLTPRQGTKTYQSKS